MTARPHGHAYAVVVVVSCTIVGAGMGCGWGWLAGKAGIHLFGWFVALSAGLGALVGMLTVAAEKARSAT